MQTNHQTGLNAEAQAKQYLTQNNYQIVAERYVPTQRRNGAGEIDFIAIKNDTYHFIEVKTRKTNTQAITALTAKQQQRLQNAALCYLSENNLAEDTSSQFDYLIVINGEIQLFENIICEM